MALNPKITIDGLPAAFDVTFADELIVKINASAVDETDTATNIVQEWAAMQDGVMRTVQARLSGGAVNVREHGATGDGATDDTAFLQAAFDAAKLVVLPAGTYVVTTDITAQAGTVVLSAGGVLSGGSITSTGALALLGVGGVSLDAEKLTLQGPTISSGTGTPEAAVTAPIGSMFMRKDGGANTSVYRKESGAGDTGWVAVTNTATAHGLGSGTHTSATLAELNALVSDATLDDSSASRPPDAHDLDAHGAATLAELNAVVSDATLDDSSASRPPAVHALDAHTAVLLAELNAVISDATLDKVGDPRPATAHDLHDHTSSTLAELNTAISDANVDAAGDTRPPAAHALDAHSAVTLAALNAKVSDATLDDSGDTRPPASHALSAHTAVTLAALNALVSDATLDDSGDSRPADAHDLNDHGSATLSELNAKVSDATLDTNTAARPPTAHDLDAHNAITLAQLNAKISDANLDDDGDARPVVAHGLGSATHTAATLAALNALVSDATLDDASDPRTPSAHGLGGHAAATLAALNAIVSDATLDDAGDSRPPDAHALDAHSAVTLAALNVLVSDATLDDSGDSRPPNAHALSAHTAVTLAALNALVSDATLDDAGDSRPPDAHALDAHSAVTLAALNAKVSDATLDTSSASRDPNAHSLGTAHTATTLAALNALISDATLDDSSATRPPAAHDLDAHGAATLAELNVVVSDATLDDSGDSRPPSGAASGDLGGTYPSPTVPIATADSERFQVVGSELQLSDNMEATMDVFVGAFLETIRITVTESVGVVSLNLDQDGGGNLTAVFTDGYFAYDTTPAKTVTLTAGTDTAPTINYVYVLQSTKVLTASTVGFPSAEHAPVATVLVQSASGVSTDGAYKLHAWTDHTFAAGNNGHLSHINRWIRYQHATWESGVAQTLTITPNGGAADNVILTTTSGVVLQLHMHTFPAFGGTPDLFVVNDSVTPFDKISDLNVLLTDALGASMSDRYFSLVVWGAINQNTGDCKLFVNLPTGSYSNNNGVTQDNDKFAEFTIPPEFRGVGFLISELKLRHQAAASGTWTSVQEVDLRGLFPAISAGSGISGGAEFLDTFFRIQDGDDDTKELAFEVSAITTGTTRTITMPDTDLTLDDSSDSRPPSGAASGDLGGTYPSPTVPIATAETERFQVVGSELQFSTNMEATMDAFIGAFLETIRITVTEAASVVSLNLDRDGGGNLTAVFTDGYFAYDTTPADTVTLTAGTDTAPTLNYVYVLQSTKTLTASTVSFPSAEHAPVATVLVQSASGVSADGVYKLHAWTDHISEIDDIGHLAHIARWVRSQHSTWESGVTQTLTITPNGGGPDNVIFTTTSGVASQLHKHTFPAFSGTPDVFVANDSVTPFTKVTDLNALLTDALGGSMTGRRFSLVIWGAVNENTGDCKLFVNLPLGTYGNNNGVIRDADKFAVFTIPIEFRGTGFLISELKLRHQNAASGTWTSVQEVDLRGLFPSIAAGSGISGGSEFLDSFFRVQDDGDDTKELAFEVSAITTGTTRTATWPDSDVTVLSLAGQLGGTAASPDVRGIRESGGTLLTNGAVADTELLARDGSNLIGAVVVRFPVIRHTAREGVGSLGANWAVNGQAPLVTDDNDASLAVRLSDAAISEGWGKSITIPTGALSMTVTTSARAWATPAGAVTAHARIHFRRILSGGSWGVEEILTDINLSTNENFVDDVTTQTLSAWGSLVAGAAYQYQVLRDGADAGDDLVGDLAWQWVQFSFS